MVRRIPRAFALGMGSVFWGALVGAVLSVAACSDFPADPKDAGTAPDATPGAPDGSPMTTGPSSLPFAIDDYFGPAYMGDGEKPGGVKDVKECAPDRGNDWKGRCHKFTWTPNDYKKFGGAFWLYPDQNWGVTGVPGLQLPAGATKIVFRAWGAVGGEIVDFGAGIKANDGFEAKLEKVPLTTTPTQYTIDLSAATYSRVIGGFFWAAGDSTVPVTIYLDDIQWQ
jgi:hypothetical protein